MLLIASLLTLPCKAQRENDLAFIQNSTARQRNQRLLHEQQMDFIVLGIVDAEEELLGPSDERPKPSPGVPNMSSPGAPVSSPGVPSPRAVALETPP